jgi:glycosyltransferase involved in cell wall biosynthesis
MVLLLTNNFPPYIGGSSQILYELLRHFPKNYFSVYHGVGSTQKNSNYLPFAIKQPKFMGSLLWTQRIIRYLPLLYSIWLVLYVSISVKKKKINAIYAHYPSAPFVIAAYYLSIILKKPLIIYYDIIWEGRGGKREDELAARYERNIVKKAKKIITINEHLAKHLEEKYQINCVTIPHTTSREHRSLLNSFKAQPKSEPIFKIHFAGAIYPRMNQDSIIRLAMAMKKLPFRCELELCSPEVPKEITDTFPVTKRFLNHRELLEAQINSDLLFLPQAFDSDSEKMIELNMPTKTMEYVCTGVPILVHSPSSSYLSWIAKKKSFAYLVEEKNEEQLKEMIIKIKNDEKKKKELIKNALNFADESDSAMWSNQFKNLIEEVISI